VERPLQAVDLIDRDRVTVGRVAEDAVGLLVELAGELESAGIVKSSFADAVVAREEVFPTGLPTEVMHVAIPHCDVQHVNRSAFLVTKLERPVRFREMGTNDGYVDVDLVVMMAIADGKAQLGALQVLMDVFTDSAFMTELQDATDANTLHDLLHSRLNEANRQH
jgi:PTS system galactitol-specific IIA component